MAHLLSVVSSRSLRSVLVLTAPEPPRPAESPVVDVSAAVGRARSTLEADLTATSQRLQRLAAAALARTQHPAARTLLAKGALNGFAAPLGVAPVFGCSLAEVAK